MQNLQARFSMSANSKNDSTTLEEQKAEIMHDGSLAIDKKKERKLVRKLDAYIVPMMMLLYLFSFLDRYTISC